MHPVDIGGNTEYIPDPGDFSWGQYTTNTLDAIVANLIFPKGGGQYTLTGDVDFGPNAGFILQYIKSETGDNLLTPVASQGMLRLSDTDVIAWRNYSNTGDNILAINSSNQLTYNGTVIGATNLTFVGDVTGSGPDTSPITLTLATVNSNVGTFGDSTHVGQFTVNAKGLITAAVAIPLATGIVSSFDLNDTSTTPIYNTTPTSPTSGAITSTLALKTQSANLIFAGPSSGSPTQPTFRALVVSDFPSGVGVPATPTTSVQFNNGGLFGGSANFEYTESTPGYPIITLGSVAGSAVEATIQSDAEVILIQGYAPAGSNASGTAISIESGEGTGTGSGGDLYLSSGQGGATSGNGGTVHVIAAGAPGTGNAGAILLEAFGGAQGTTDLSIPGGSLVFRTSVSGTSKYVVAVNQSGAIGVGANTSYSGLSFGTNGQVLTSSGSGSSPTWTTPTAYGSVSSVGLALPGIFSVSGSPVTTSGTLTGSLVAQAANTIFVGPASGPNATPTFRALVSADLPSGTGTVTSVGVSSSGTYSGAITVGSSPITTSGTITLTPNLFTSTVAGIVPSSGGGTTNFLRADGTWAAPAGTTYSAGTGLSLTGTTFANTGVLSVSLNDNSTTAIYTASPTTATTGTVAATLTLKTQNANLVFAGPSSGGAAQPTFRALVSADIPNNAANTTGTSSNVTGTVAIANGGTGQTTASAAFNALSPITTTGDLIIGNGTNSATRLGIGTNTYVLTSNGTTASWQAASGGGVSSVSTSDAALTISPTTGAVVVSSNQFTSSTKGVVPSSGGGTTNFLRADGTWTAPSGGGSVTSVALSDGSTTPIYAISGSPITGSGTLTFTLDTQTANTVFAGPTTGSAAQPTFRALVSADIPNNAANTTGTAAGLAGGAASEIPYQTGSGATSFISNGTSGQVLISKGSSAPVWGTLPFFDYLTTNYTNATTTATNVFTGTTTTANHVYLIEYQMEMWNSAGSNISQLQITAPSGSTVTGTYMGRIGGTNSGTIISGINTLQGVPTATGSGVSATSMSFCIIVTTSTTTGTLTLGSAGSSGTTTIAAGSWLRITDLTLLNATQN